MSISNLKFSCLRLRGSRGLKKGFGELFKFYFRNNQHFGLTVDVTHMQLIEQKIPN